MASVVTSDAEVMRQLVRAVEASRRLCVELDALAVLACRAPERTRAQLWPGLVGVVGGSNRTMRYLLGTDEVAEVLNVSRRTVQNLLASGELPSVKIEARRLVPFDEVTAFIDRLRGLAS